LSPRRAGKRRESDVVADGPGDEATAEPEEAADPDLSTPEQRLAASRQFERAREVLAAGDNDEYARHLLLSACHRAPVNLRHRQTLRQVKRKPDRLLGRLTAPLGKMAGKARMQAAVRKGEYLKVLEYGEEAVAADPKDIGAHLAMSGAAE